MKLFNSFSGTGYHTSIITTFGVDFDAYESIVLPRLREAGCNNNILIADERMLGHAMTNSLRVPKFAGRRYSVVAAKSRGVFHPKIILQLGASSARLLVASANTTAAGLAGNLEVVGEVLADEQNPLAVPVIRAALNYLTRHLPEGSVPRRQLDWALRRARWLNAIAESEPIVRLSQTERLGFIASDNLAGIGQRYLTLVGSKPVKRLVVMSPYWDVNLGAFRELKESLKPAKTIVLIQPESALFPVDAWKPSNTSVLYGVGQIAGATRFAHAKVLIAETEEHDCILYGSANCTQAALGKSGEPGTNDEACLYRELPAGEAVRLLGLEKVFESPELQGDDLPRYMPAESLPLEELEQRLPGRFELSGELLRWWPPQSMNPSGTEVILLDFEAKNLAANVTRVSGGDLPVRFHFQAEELPAFAMVRYEGKESAIAPIVVEQAIHETQRRKVTKGIEGALAQLEDEPYEGLWLLDVIQKLDAAEHGSREASQELARGPRVGESRHDDAPSRKLTYEQFISGRKSANVVTPSGSHLASSHQESVRSFLNALIGKRSYQCLHIEEEAVNFKQMFSMGDETADGSQAIDDGNEHFTPDGHQGKQESPEKENLRRALERVKDTQAAIAETVRKFIKTQQEEALHRDLGVLELLRLRALLMVVLGAGSLKSKLLPTDLQDAAGRNQVLPCSGDVSWRRQIGILLHAFFRNGSGSQRPLIEKIVLEMDEAFGLPDDVLECWATCFWAICAGRIARDESGNGFKLSDYDQKIALDLYRYTRLMPEEALSQTVQMIFDGMSGRYAKRLGVSAEDVLVEHRKLIEISRAEAGATA